MNIRLLLAGLVVCVSVAATAATSLTESTFTEIIKEAKVVAAATKNATPARTNEVFRVPDMVRTGPDSRVEMTAPDKTITRIGANTIFTFDPAERIIHLQKGSVLFHSPAGAGGGAIKNRGTAAAVLGTTLVGAILEDGSFKILVLEGEGKVTLRNGQSITLKAGEMVIVSPGGEDFSPVATFNLGQLVTRLLLVVGFSNPLSSMPLIDAAIQQQNAQITAGNAGQLVSVQIVGIGLDMTGKTGSDIPPTLFNLSDLTIYWVSPVQP